MKKINFLKKTPEKFEIVTWSDLDFALENSTKNDIFLTSCFSPVKYRDRRSEKIDFLKKDLKNF